MLQVACDLRAQKANSFLVLGLLWAQSNENANYYVVVLCPPNLGIQKYECKTMVQFREARGGYRRPVPGGGGLCPRSIALEAS
jgi:hypothetical protein